MRVVIPGGTGHVGAVLRRAFAARGDDVTVLGRQPQPLEPGIRHVLWDGRSPGDWVAELDGADAVVNLAGRSVSCRYTDANLRQMMASGVDSTRAVGRAVASVSSPPRVWLQMSTATIYADSRSRPDDLPHDEANGILGGEEPDVPLSWEYSVRIARRLEEAQAELDLPRTRRVALRTAMVMSPDRGSVFDYLSRLARVGLGGPVAGGRQYVSWIHGEDFVRAVAFLCDRDDVDGPVILAAPDPVPQRELMASLRRAWGGRPGLPAGRRLAAGRTRGTGVAFRHGAVAQEPACGAGQASRRRLRLRSPHLGGRSPGSRGPAAQEGPPRLTAPPRGVARPPSRLRLTALQLIG